MRASELIGCRVVTTAGEDLGKVLGIRSVQDGPVRGVNAMLRVGWLVVHRHALGAFLGYQLREQQGPHAIGWLFRYIHRDAKLIAWDDIVDRTTDTITVRWRDNA